MKRIFISFATEDIRLRDLLVGQSKNDNCPFEFVDMSVKKPCIFCKLWYNQFNLIWSLMDFMRRYIKNDFKRNKKT